MHMILLRDVFVERTIYKEYLTTEVSCFVSTLQYYGRTRIITCDNVQILGNDRNRLKYFINEIKSLSNSQNACNSLVQNRSSSHVLSKY